MLQRYFTDSLSVTVGGQEIISYHYFGPAHTDDNIVSYIPSERILFGGCMIKELGAGKGNLLDANKSEWPKTVAKVKAKFPKAKLIVPWSWQARVRKKLFDYTIALFSELTILSRIHSMIQSSVIQVAIVAYILLAFRFLMVGCQEQESWLNPA